MTESITAELLRILCFNAYAAYRNTIVGDPAPRIAEEFQHAIHPQPGDLVLEISTLGRNSESRNFETRVGRLLRVAYEPVTTQAGLDDMHSAGDYWTSLTETLADIPTERVWYIKPLVGSLAEVRWTDADFIRIHEVYPSSI